MCPANSVSEEEGLAQCTCVEGYYRALQGEEDSPCNRKLLTKYRSIVYGCILMLVAIVMACPL